MIGKSLLYKCLEDGQPWHDGHQALFKRCVVKTGQVIIQVRDVEGASGGDGQMTIPLTGMMFAQI